MKVRGFPRLFLLKMRNPFIYLFNKYLLNGILSQCPRKQILGRDLHRGVLLESTLEDKPSKGLREAELVRKGRTEMNLPQRT